MIYRSAELLVGEERNEHAQRAFDFRWNPLVAITIRAKSDRQIRLFSMAF